VKLLPKANGLAMQLGVVVKKTELMRAGGAKSGGWGWAMTIGPTFQGKRKKEIAQGSPTSRGTCIDHRGCEFLPCSTSDGIAKLARCHDGSRAACGDVIQERSGFGTMMDQFPQPIALSPATSYTS
jgi:hypothetical protein